MAKQYTTQAVAGIAAAVALALIDGVAAREPTRSPIDQRTEGLLADALTSGQEVKAPSRSWTIDQLLMVFALGTLAAGLGYRGYRGQARPANAATHVPPPLSASRESNPISEA